jgi:ribulose-phosphate 3-epimerase
MVKFLIASSILFADFSKLGKEIHEVEKVGADWIHVDVMDGQFVFDLTIGAPVVKSLRPVTDKILDVHLMIENPENLIDDFIEAGSDIVTIHIESTKQASEIFEKLKMAKVKCGITLRPKTSLQDIKPFLHLVDLVLVMTVEPGFGGQSFMQDQVIKIKELKKLREENSYNYLIEVDGGVNEKTVHECLDADVLVAGSFIFKSDYKKQIEILKSAKK